MSRILGKFIQDSTVTDLQIRLRNNLALRARNAGDTADIEILKISASDVLTILREMSMDNNKITNLADPTNALDAANKQYVDSVMSGLSDPKESARVATTAALPSATYANGTNGVGATLTADANGAFPSVDGVALSQDERILVKNQAAGLENGIYTLTQVGDGGNPWILTRAEDANEGSAHASEGDANLVSQGMFVNVSEGTLNGSLGYLLTTADPISLGVTALSFAQLGEVIQAGQGLSKTGQTLSVDNGDGLGFSGNQLIVLVDDDLVTGSTKIDGSGNVVSTKRFEESFTLNGTDISNNYVDLSKVASENSVLLFPRFGIRQKDVIDYVVSPTGGAGGKTRITFAGDLQTIIASGDIIDLNFNSLDY